MVVVLNTSFSTMELPPHNKAWDDLPRYAKMFKGPASDPVRMMSSVFSSTLNSHLAAATADEPASIERRQQLLLSASEEEPLSLPKSFCFGDSNRRSQHPLPTTIHLITLKVKLGRKSPVDAKNKAKWTEAERKICDEDLQTNTATSVEELREMVRLNFVIVL